MDFRGQLADTIERKTGQKATSQPAAPEKKPSYLSMIETGPSPGPRRIFLYSVHGLGKSTWASEAPKPIFLPTEDGLGDIDCNHFPVAKSYAEVIGYLSALYTDKHPYQTLVIDTVDWLEKLLWKEVCIAEGVLNIERIGYAKGYKYVLTLWKDIVEGLTALRADRSMTIILLSHAQIERFNNPEGDDYDRFSPDIHKYASALLQEWVDEVLFATYETFTKTEDKGFGQKKAKAIGTGKRVIRTSARPAFMAKNRLGLPDSLSMEIGHGWEAFAKHIKGGGKKKKK